MSKEYLYWVLVMSLVLLVLGFSLILVGLTYEPIIGIPLIIFGVAPFVFGIGGVSVSVEELKHV